MNKHSLYLSSVLVPVFLLVLSSCSSSQTTSLDIVDSTEQKYVTPDSISDKTGVVFDLEFPKFVKKMVEGYNTSYQGTFYLLNPVDGFTPLFDGCACHVYQYHDKDDDDWHYYVHERYCIFREELGYTAPPDLLSDDPFPVSFSIRLSLIPCVKKDGEPFTYEFGTVIEEHPDKNYTDKYYYVNIMKGGEQIGYCSFFSNLDISKEYYCTYLNDNLFYFDPEDPSTYSQYNEEDESSGSLSS